MTGLTIREGTADIISRKTMGRDREFISITTCMGIIEDSRCSSR
jgi:hypothetical protein